MYTCQRKLNAIKVDALHSYIRYLPDQYHEFYPPADPDELKRCKEAQKQKRDSLRALINLNDHDRLDDALDALLLNLDAE